MLKRTGVFALVLLVFGASQAIAGGPKPKYVVSRQAAIAINVGLIQAAANEGAVQDALSSACKIVSVEKNKAFVLDDIVPGSGECASLANPVNMTALSGVFDPSAHLNFGSGGIRVESNNGVFSIAKPFWRSEYGKPEIDIAREVIKACGEPIAPEPGSFAQYNKTPTCLAAIDANAVALLQFMIWVDKGDSSSPVVSLIQDFPGGDLPAWFRGEGL